MPPFERMTAYSVAMLGRFGAQAGLAMEGDAVPGPWSGAVAVPIGAQEVVVLRKPR